MFNSKQELKEYIRSKVRSVLVESKQIATTYQFSPAQFKVLKDFGVKSSTSGNELFIPELVYIDLQKNRKDSKFKQDMYDTVPPSDEYLVSQILTGLKKSLNTGKTANIKDQKHFVLSGTLTKNGNFNFLNPYRKEQPKEEDQPINTNQTTDTDEYPMEDELGASYDVSYRNGDFYVYAYDDLLNKHVYPGNKISFKGKNGTIVKAVVMDDKDGDYYKLKTVNLQSANEPANTPSPKHGNTKWTEDTISQEAAKYSSRREFQLNNQAAYVTAYRRGLLDKLFPGGNTKWTEDTLSQEAAKYSSKGEFAKNNRAAYVAAHRKGLLSKLFSDGKPNKKWNEDLISQEAAKYSSRSEFAKNKPAAYLAAIRAGLLDKLFPKNKKDQNIPTPTPDAPDWLSLFRDTDFLEEVNKYRK
jgi:hypothetical protein